MTLLGKNSTIADRQRGCIFAETFKDSASVIANRGTIVGAPTIDNGVVFDGTLKYITYQQYLTSSTFSINIEFTPTFAYDAGDIVTWYDTNTLGTGRYLLNKFSNNYLYVTAGTGTTIMTIAPAAYGPYWLINQRNVLTITGVSGSNNAYLNGYQINNSSTAWAPAHSTGIRIGCDIGTTQRFMGTIHSFKAYNKILSKKEHDAEWNQTPFSQYSLLGGYDTIADRQRGCIFSVDTDISFNGTTDYYQYNQYLGVPEYSISAEFTPTFAHDDGLDHVFWETDNTTAGRNFLYKPASGYLYGYSGNTLVLSAAPAVYGAYWLTNQRNVITLTSKSGSNYLYLNGNQIATSATAWTYKKLEYFMLGRLYAAAVYYFAGTLHSVKAYNKILSKKEHDNQWNQIEQLPAPVLWLPMGTDQHDPGGNRTLDVSGNGYHAVKGTNMPTKLTSRHGYYFDGVNTNFVVDKAACSATDEFSLSMLIDSANLITDSTLWSAANTIPTAYHSVLFFVNSVKKLYFYVGSSASPAVGEALSFNSPILHAVCRFRNSPALQADIFVNNIKGTTAAAPVQAVALTRDVYMGTFYEGSYDYRGNILSTRFYNKFLSEKQIANLYWEEMKRYNAV